MRPDELNDTTDERIWALVDALVLDADGRREEQQPLAPFMTLEVLRRVHERVVLLKNSGACRIAKHKALARAMCGMTGVREPPDERDTDQIGNHIDIWFRRKYIDVERKLHCNTRNKENLEKKCVELRAQCCIVSAMGRIQEFHGPFDAESPTAPLAARTRPAPYVPYTQSSFARRNVDARVETSSFGGP